MQLLRLNNCNYSNQQRRNSLALTMTEFGNLILEFRIRTRTQQFTLMPLCSVSYADVGNESHESP